jgi:glycosyltransferase 2 family protein
LRNRALAAVLGVGVTVALLAWVLRDVSFAEVWTNARQARLAPLLIAIVLATSTFVLRLFRWRLILRADDGSALGWTPLWHAIAIGFTANNILPFRAGEVIRALTVNRLTRVKLSSALSSLVLERLFDGITIVTLLFVGLVTAGIPASAEVAGLSVRTLATRTAALLGVLLAVCLAALAFPELAKRVLRRLIPSARLADKVAGFIDGVRGGLSALSSPTRIIGVTLWSFVVWGVNGASFYYGFKAFGIGVGYGGALLQQSLLVLGIAVPSSPGFFGPFEAAIRAVLALFGVAGGAAVSFALTYHFTTFLPITLLGLWSLARTPVSLSSMQETPVAEPAQ